MTTHENDFAHLCPLSFKDDYIHKVTRDIENQISREAFLRSHKIVSETLLLISDMESRGLDSYRIVEDLKSVLNDFKLNMQMEIAEIANRFMESKESCMKKAEKKRPDG